MTDSITVEQLFPISRLVSYENETQKTKKLSPTGINPILDYWAKNSAENMKQLME